MSSLLIHNIGMLATPEGLEARRGADQGSIRVLENAWIYTENGEIISCGTGNPPITFGEKLDAGGRLVTPGLVDAHTHLIFGGWRQNELAMKIRNVPSWTFWLPAAESSPPSRQPTPRLRRR